MLPRQILLFFALLLLHSESGKTQEAAPRLLSTLQQAGIAEAIAAEMEQQHLVGVAVGVIQEGEIAYLKGFGFENRELDTPVTSQTLFRWASISKTLTAIAAMQLVESGKLDLEDDVRKYVPEFPDKGETITVRDLLCHQSGIVHYTNGTIIRTRREYAEEHPFENVILALDRFQESPLVAKPREKFSYTTHGYILLSAVVQRAGGEKYADQIRKRIREPLGLKSLQPDYQWIEIPHRAVGYRYWVRFTLRSSDTDVSWKLGGGGFLSSIDDLANYAAGLMSDKLINEQTKQIAWKRQTTSSGELTGMGLGFSIRSANRKLEVSHNGSQEKAKTRLVIWPDSRRGIVVMSNSENADPNQLAKAVEIAMEWE